METWIVNVCNSILGPVAVQVRRPGRKYMMSADAPPYVREYLNLPEDRHARSVIGGMTYADLRSLGRRARNGGLRLEVSVAPPPRPAPRPRYTVKEHGPLIRHFRGLLDYFGADTPRTLNRRVYKSTDCGASISVMLHDGTWVHNGDAGWQTMTGDEPIAGFTIQTIVEGSDATVDSDLFTLPCPESYVQAWIADMEAQAEELWTDANEVADA
jgi:hypothetical protein